MIMMESKIFVVDNAGAKRGKCIQVMGNTGSTPCSLVVLSIQKIKGIKKIFKGDICRGVIVRLRKNLQRDTGLCINFGDNSVVLIDPKFAPLGSRLYGPVFKEFRFAIYNKVLSLAKTMI